MSDTSPTDTNSSWKKGHNRRRGKTGDGEDKLNVIRPVRYRFNVAVDYRTYRLADVFPKYDMTLSKNVTKDGEAYDGPDVTSNL